MTQHDEDHEFELRVHDDLHQLLARQVARKRGLKANIPGRSRKKVILYATRPQAQAVANEAARIGELLQLKQFEALEAILQEHALEVPLELQTTISICKGKVALASGKVPSRSPISASTHEPRSSSHDGTSAGSRQ